MYIIHTFQNNFLLFFHFSDAGSCKHVVCLLFAVEAFIRKQMDNGKATCTDEPCMWNRPRKESHPVQAQNLDFRHDKSAPKKVGVESFTPLKSVTVNTIQDIRSQLLGICEAENPTPLLVTMIDRTPHTPPSMSQLVSEYKNHGSDDLIKFLSERTSAEDRRYFRELSQEDLAWLAAREGRITASLAGDIKSLRDQSEGRTLVQKILGTAPSFSSAAIDYGKTHEGVARQLYEEKMSRQHKAFVCETTGLHISSDVPFLGASPDGMASCKCHGKRVVEIKCTAKHRNLRVVDIPAVDPSYHFQYQDGHLRLKKSSKWYYQVQFQMGVVGVDNCDFVIFTKCGIEVLNISFEDTVYAEVKAKAIRIFSEKVVPLM